MNPAGAVRSNRQSMTRVRADPVVHLELCTSDAASACRFYARMFGWTPEAVHVGSTSYLTLDVGGGIEAGVAVDSSAPPSWLPYVAVGDIAFATERARLLGGAIMLDSREGPAGWRSVVAAPGGARIALWQAKAHELG